MIGIPLQPGQDRSQMGARQAIVQTQISVLVACQYAQFLQVCCGGLHFGYLPHGQSRASQRQHQHHTE